MARRRTKKRTQTIQDPGTFAGGPPAHANANRIPKTMVIRIGAGEVGPSISSLVLDVRKMLEPHTAIRLKVGRLGPKGYDLS